MRENTQVVPIRANVDKVYVKVMNRSGQSVLEGYTPLTASLKTAQSGYFSPERYTVEAVKEGYYPARTIIDWRISKWYALGNLGFGGLIGYLIIDPITGDMYYLDEEVNLNMTPIEK